MPIQEHVSVEGVQQAVLLPEIPEELANWVAALKRNHLFRMDCSFL